MKREIEQDPKVHHGYFEESYPRKEKWRNRRAIRSQREAIKQEHRKVRHDRRQSDLKKGIENEDI